MICTCRYVDCTPTKLLCFTRSSTLINQLLPYPSKAYTDVERKKCESVLCRIVHEEATEIVLYKLNVYSSQNHFEKSLHEFASNDGQKLFVMITSMQDFVGQRNMKRIVNHLRIMIENAENETMLSLQNTKHVPKMFIVLLHFPPEMFYSACYPSLFMRGWEHYYIDSIAHTSLSAFGTEKAVLDIKQWVGQLCLSEPTSEIINFEVRRDIVLKKINSGEYPMTESMKVYLHVLQDSKSLEQRIKILHKLDRELDLMSVLHSDVYRMLDDTVPLICSRVVFGSHSEARFNCKMSSTKRSDLLKELFNDKGFGKVLCSCYCSLWEPEQISQQIRVAADFMYNNKSTLNLTDTVQTSFKSSFYGFIVYMVSVINENFNLDLLFEESCPEEVSGMFKEFLLILPHPPLHILNQQTIEHKPPPSINKCSFMPTFPFFHKVFDIVENIIEQSREAINIEILEMRKKEGRVMRQEQENFEEAICIHGKEHYGTHLKVCLAYIVTILIQS